VWAAVALCIMRYPAVPSTGCDGHAKSRDSGIGGDAAVPMRRVRGYLARSNHVRLIGRKKGGAIVGKEEVSMRYSGDNCPAHIVRPQTLTRDTETSLADILSIAPGFQGVIDVLVEAMVRHAAKHSDRYPPVQIPLVDGKVLTSSPSSEL